MLYIFRFLHQTTTATPKPRPGAQLYIFRFLHQTTTIFFKVSATASLYIFRFLHQTTTFYCVCVFNGRLYIFRFLHQTTTTYRIILQVCRCISFVSYIKPQLDGYKKREAGVVYLSFPTSNHNCQTYLII